eukprot:6204848-Pleurochrysis_carterae.AAC.1
MTPPTVRSRAWPRALIVAACLFARWSSHTIIFRSASLGATGSTPTGESSPSRQTSEQVASKAIPQMSS